MTAKRSTRRVGPAVPCRGARAISLLLAPLVALGAAPALASEAPEPPPALVMVRSAPSVVVVAGAPPFVLLDAAVLAGEGGPALRIVYLASTRSQDARAADTDVRCTGTAAVLLERLAPVLAAGVERAEVVAVFGASGGWGVALPARASRTGGRWAPAALEASRPVLLPALPERLARPVEAEEAAVEAARRFLARADAGDADGAWALVSAAARAELSRQAFGQAIGTPPSEGPPPQRWERFRRYELRTGRLGLGDVVEVCLEGAGGLDRLQVRLDDDQAWRVSLYEHREPSPGGPGAASRRVASRGPPQAQAVPGPALSL
ncbi:MAG: hypothetical protein QM767_26865 [Anaeromyxobacter sp.]